jgi:hypothetical protein
MNTKEINSSAWPLKFFFISAFPLVAATVFLPLIAVPVFGFTIRHITLARAFLKKAWIFLTFILYLLSDALISSPLDFPVVTFSLYWFASCLNLFVISFAIIDLFKRLGGLFEVFRYARKHIGWSCFWLLAVTSVAIGYLVSWVEFFPYVLFFIITLFRRTKRRRIKRASTLHAH